MAILVCALVPGKSQVPSNLTFPQTSASAVVEESSVYVTTSTYGNTSAAIVNVTLGASSLKPNFTDAIPFPVMPHSFCLLERQDRCVMHCNNGTCVFCTLEQDAPWFIWESMIGHGIGLAWYIFRLWILIRFLRCFMQISPSLIPWCFCITVVCGLLMCCTPLDRTVGCKPDLPGPLEDFGESDAFLCSTSTKYYEYFRMTLFGTGLRASCAFGLGLEKNFALMYWSPVDYTTCSPKTCRFNAQSSDTDSADDTEEEDWENRPMAWRLSRDNPQLTGYYDALYDAFAAYSVTVYFADNQQYAGLDLGFLDCIIRIDFGDYEQDIMAVGVGPFAFVRACEQVGVRPRYQAQGFLGLLLPQTMSLEFLEKTGLFVAQMLVSTTRKQKFLNFLVYASNLVSLCQHYGLSSANIQWLIDGSKDLSTKEEVPQRPLHTERKIVVDSIFSEVSSLESRKVPPLPKGTSEFPSIDLPQPGYARNREADDRAIQAAFPDAFQNVDSMEAFLWERMPQDREPSKHRVPDSEMRTVSPQVDVMTHFDRESRPAGAGYDPDSGITTFMAQGFVEDFAAVLGSSIVASSLKIISLVWVLLFIVPERPKDMLAVIDSTLHWKTPLDVGLSISTSVLKHFLLLARRTTAFFASGDWRTFVLNDSETFQLEMALDALDVRLLALERLPQYGLTLAAIEKDAQDLVLRDKMNLSVNNSLEAKRIHQRLEKFLFDCKTKMRALSSRPQPFGVMFSGGAGIGKSKVLDLFKANFAAWKPTGVDLDPSNVYVRTQGEKFWSGLKSSHWAITFDDLAQENTRMLGPGVNPVGELINVINNVPYFPEMAGVDEKGFVGVNALLVMVTTNNPELNLHHTASHPGAVNRRLAFDVRPKVRPQFCKTGQPMIDAKKCVKANGDPELDCWIFDVHIYEERSTGADWFIYDSLQNLSGGDFWRLMAYFVKKHFDGQKHSDRFTTAASQIKHCACCHVPVEMCARPANTNLERWIQFDSQSGELPIESLVEGFYTYGWLGALLVGFVSAMLYYFLYQIMATCAFVAAAYTFWKLATYEGLLPLFSLIPALISVCFFFLWLGTGAFHTMSILALCLNLFVVSRVRVYDAKIETIMTRTFVLWSAYTYFMNIVTWTGDSLEWLKLKCLQWWWLIWLGEHRVVTFPKFVYRQVTTQRWAATAMVAFVLFVCASTLVWSRVFDPLIAQGGETPVEPREEEPPKNPWVIPDRIALKSIMSRCSVTGTRVDLEQKLTDVAKMEFRREGGTGAFCWAIPLARQSWLVPSHFVKEAESLGIPMRLTRGRQTWTWNPHRTTVRHHPEEEYSVIDVVGVPVADSLRFVANTSRLGDQCFDGIVTYPRLGFVQCANMRRTPGNLAKTRYSSGHTIWGISGQLQSETALGDCGVPLLNREGTAIMGMHIGGLGKKAFFSALDPNWLSQNIAEAPAAQGGVLLGLPNGKTYQNLADVPRKSPFRWEPLGNMCVPHSVLGQLDTMVQRFTSRVGPTMFCEFWSQYYSTTKMRPCIGTGDALEAPLWKIKTNFLVNASLERDFYDVSALKAAVESLRSRFQGLDWSQWCVLDHDRTLYGVPQQNFCRGMKFSTSAGVPYCKAKHFVMDFNSESGKFDLTQQQRDRVSFMENNAQQGLVPGLLFRATLKDEPIKMEKLVNGKIRIFQASSLESTYLMRKYFLTAGAVLCQDFRHSEIAVGMNCHGTQWDELYIHLFQEGWRAFCGDYSNFDQNMSGGILFEAWSLVISMGNLTERDRRICLSLATDASNPLTDFFGDLIRLSGTNPSGHSMTVIINGVVNSLYMRYAYYKIHDQCDDFNDYVRMVTYGDDNVVVVHPKRQGTFNQKTVSAALATIMVTYTDAQKSKVVPEFTAPQDYSFLKRSWVKEGDIWLAPLEEDSIGKMLLVGIKSDAEFERHVSILRSSCLEMFHFGRARYDEHIDRIRDLGRWLQTQGPEHQALAAAISSVNFLTWDERLELRNGPGGTSWFEGTDVPLEELVCD